MGSVVSSARRALLDNADRRVLGQVLAILVVIVLVALALGLAVRAFLWASGLGG